MIIKPSEEKKYNELLPQNRSFKLALTSGCFDLIHAGHIYFLEEMQKQTKDAKQLIVIHSDTAVKNHKGENRPILREFDRAAVLNAIKGIEYVIIWPGWEDIADLVYQLKPEYLIATAEKIKASKWENSWSNVAKKINAKLIGIPEIDHETSTTRLIEHIKNKTN